MPFDDLANGEPDEEEAADPGGEALDELAGTLSGDTKHAPDESSDDSEEVEDSYDPQSDSAFPSAKDRTQHSIYCLPSTWKRVDGPSGLLFDAEILLRRNEYGNVQKRELHNALLIAAADELSAEDIAEAFIAAREQRVDGPLLEE